jgi:hypothetical protein
VPSDSQVIDINGFPAGTIFAINIKPQASSNSTHKLMSNGTTGMYGWLNEEVTAAFSTTTLSTLTTQGLYIWRKRDALTGQNFIKFVCTSPGGGGTARAKIFAISNPNFGLPIQVMLAQNTLPLPNGAATETTLGAIKSAVELLDNAVSGNSIAVTGPLTNSQLRASAFEIRGSAGTLATSTGIAPENSTEVLVSSESRKYLLFQNLSTAPIHINFTNPASLSTLRIDARATLVFEGSFIPNNAINIIRTAPEQSYFIAYLQ